jgi:DNA-binding MarR family transcriptional regulator
MSTTSTSLELCLRLTRAYAVLTRRLDSKLSSVHGLSFGDFMVLHCLSRAEGSRLRRIDLAERMGLTASGVTRTLLPLEKIGLVARESDPRDARVGYATLTPAGQELHGYALASAEVICQDATQAVSGEQLAAVVDLLGGLAGINAANA